MINVVVLALLLTVSLVGFGQSNLADTYSNARQQAFGRNYERALDLCDSILGVNPDYYDAEVLKARVTAWEGDLESSLKQSKGLTEKYPESKEVVELYAQVNHWIGDSEEAAQILQDALLKWPGDYSFMLALAKEYNSLFKIDDGLMLCDSLLHNDQKVIEAFSVKLDLLLTDEQYDSVITLSDSLISKNPNNLNLRMIRAKAKAWNKELPDSRADLDTVFMLDKKLLSGHHLHVNTFLWQAENDSAVWAIDSAMKFYPEDIPLRVMLANAFLRLDSLQACDSVSALVLEEDTLNYDAWAVSLNSRLAQEQYDSTLNALNMLDTIYPADEELKRARVLALAGNKKYKEAIDEMGDVSVVDSMDESSQVLYTKLHYWDGKNSESLELADHFLDAHPRSVPLLTTKTIIHKSRFEKKKAMNTIDEAIAIDSTDASLRKLKQEVEDMILNELGGWLTYDIYSNSVDPSGNRSALNLEYLRRVQRHVFVARLTLADRFDSLGIQGEIDAYPTITDWMYVYCNIGASNNWLFPEFRAGIEPYVALPYKLEASLGVRYMQYPTDGIVIYTGSISAYPGNYYFSFRPFFTNTQNGLNQSYNVKARRFFDTPKSYVELSGGLGSSPDNSYLDQSFDQLVESQSWNIGVTYQQQFGKSFYGKAFVFYEQYYPEQFPDFSILSLNLGGYWMF